MKLLHIDSSILGDHSVSRQLTAAIVARLQEATPDLEILRRDLAANPLPHLSGALLAASAPGAPAPDPATQAALDSSAAVLSEFLAADIVVVGAPMYNFAISSQLKAWIDRLVIAGKTFRYSNGAVEGLAGGRRLIIASSRGGVFEAGAAAAALDYQETYLRAIFGFIGIADVEIIRAEGLAFGEDARALAIKQAGDAILRLEAA